MTTYGYDTIGSQSLNNITDNTAPFVGITIAAGQNFKVEHMYIHGAGVGTEPYLKGCVWNSNLTLNAVLGTVESNGAPVDWSHITASPQPELTAGSTYFIGFVKDTEGNFYLSNDRPDLGTGYWKHVGNNYASPATLTRNANIDYLWSIYVTGTEVAGGYANDVFGVATGDIDTVFGVETANIDKVFGS